MMDDEILKMIVGARKEGYLKALEDAKTVVGILAESSQDNATGYDYMHVIDHLKEAIND